MYAPRSGGLTLEIYCISLIGIRKLTSFGGNLDTTTPTDIFLKVWEAVKLKGQGGIIAELQGGTHNDDAWAPAEDYDNPHLYNVGRYHKAVWISP
mgnify:CR=1 FL=1